MNTIRSFSILLAAGVLAAAATVGAAGAAPPTAKVSVKLVEFKLLPSARSVAPGKIMFVVKDAGQLSHEFVVLRTATPAAKLPSNGMTAVETGKVGKIAKFGPGQTRTLVLTLKPGHYVLLCNLPGHYKAGQHADLTVR